MYCWNYKKKNLLDGIWEDNHLLWWRRRWHRGRVPPGEIKARGETAPGSYDWHLNATKSRKLGFSVLQNTYFKFFFHWDKLTLSRLEGKHTRKRSSDELKAVERSSPVLVLFVWVHNWDAQEQQQFYRYLTRGEHKCKTIYNCRPFRLAPFMDFISLVGFTHTDSPTFMTLNTLQLHGFLLHFLLSSGFRELSRMWAVDAEFGKSDPYSVPEKHMYVISSDLQCDF